MEMMAHKFYQRIMMLTIGVGLLTTIVVYYGPTVKLKQVLLVELLTLDVTKGALVIQKRDPALPRAVGGQLAAKIDTIGGWSAGSVMHSTAEDFWIHWDSNADLRVEYVKEGSTDCYTVTWASLSRAFIPYDCFYVGQDHWYGGAEVLHDRWTIEKQPMKMQHYLSNDIGMVLDGYGNVLERYWLSSTGVTITVDDKVPLHVSVNQTQLCFKADYHDSRYQNPGHILPVLVYKVCSSKDVRAAHIFVAAVNFKPPKQIPNLALFLRPIWSTWAQFRTKISQDKVIQYANEIKKHGFDGCHIEIDDGYTKHYGDFEFDPDKFPSPLKMSRKLQALGFNVTTWVTPFTNVDSVNYKEGFVNDYFVKSRSKSRTNNLNVKWWRGLGGVLDFTNPDAVKWMDMHLQKLKEQGVTAFKFDAGEANFLPGQFLTKNWIANGNHYGRLYASHMHNLTLNRHIEVRVGYQSQHLPVMVRMMDKDSDWGYARGIQTLIPTALLFGVLGYPFVLPDMVGGNGLIGNRFVVPSKELYLRWVAATIMLPFIQFSIPPWSYDEETVQIVHELLELRKTHLKFLLRAARESAQSAYPIIRPLWWADPKNRQTHHIDSQFLVGDELLVAPILHEGSTARSVYLPKGTWKDVREGKVFPGKRYIHNYTVALNQLAIFTRISSKTLHVA